MGITYVRRSQHTGCNILCTDFQGDRHIRTYTHSKVDLGKIHTELCRLLLSSFLSTVILNSTDGSTLRGFLVQSRLTADNTTRVGTFAAATGTNAQLRSCPNTGVSLAITTSCPNTGVSLAITTSCPNTGVSLAITTSCPNTGVSLAITTSCPNTGVSLAITTYIQYTYIQAIQVRT